MPDATVDILHHITDVLVMAEQSQQKIFGGCIAITFPEESVYVYKVLNDDESLNAIIEHSERYSTQSVCIC